MTLKKDEIIKQLQDAGKQFISIASSIDQDIFFQQPPEKWSISQNVQHLIISANTTRLAFRLPKFLIRLYVGKPNRSSRSYEELVHKYKIKLQEGGKASGRFIPPATTPTTGKERLLLSYRISMDKLIQSINKNWADLQLDQFIAPHPLLGKITLRELCYFTIYHTYHHLDIIKERLRENTNIPT